MHYKVKARLIPEVAAEFHDVINGFRLRHAFHPGIKCLVDHGHEDPVGDKPRPVVRGNRGFPHLFGDGEGTGGGLFAGGQPLDDFDQFHDRDRVHEVQTHEPRRVPGVGCDRGEGDRGRVGREQRVVLGVLRDLLPERGLQLAILGDRGGTSLRAGKRDCQLDLA